MLPGFALAQTPEETAGPSEGTINVGAQENLNTAVLLPKPKRSYCSPLDDTRYPGVGWAGDAAGVFKWISLVDQRTFLFERCRSFSAGLFK